MTRPEALDGRLLAALGVPADDEALYRVLLRSPHATLADLGEATGWLPARLRRHLRGLESIGLLTRTPTRPVRYIPAAPDAAAEVLALKRQEEIERSRASAALLAEEFRVASGDASPVTIVRGREANAHRFFQTQQATRNEILILDKAPYLVEPVDRQLAVQASQLRRGVSYRTIYDETSLGTTEKLIQARELASQGEQSRVLADVPLKLVVSDRKIALVPFVLATEQETMVLQSSALLDGLITLFELLWQRATPLWSPGPRQPGPGTLTEEDELLLALSAAGLTDEAVARRLGVAQRTVERRMRRVMNLLGAQTRFQAGLQAARLGILGSP